MLAVEPRHEVDTWLAPGLPAMGALLMEVDPDIPDRWVPERPGLVRTPLPVDGEFPTEMARRLDLAG